MKTELSGADYMHTYTGKQFRPTHPRVEDVCIEDIAHGLSNVCRFGGQCREFYSVAQHSLYVSHQVEVEGGRPDDVRWALLHDASEAYLGDCVHPLKRQLPDYKVVEARLNRVLRLWSGVAQEDISSGYITTYSRVDEALIKHADHTLLVTEARDLCGNPAWVGEWCEKYKVLPWPGMIRPWEPKKAERMFLQWWSTIKPASVWREALSLPTPDKKG